MKKRAVGTLCLTLGVMIFAVCGMKESAGSAVGESKVFAEKRKETIEWVNSSASASENAVIYTSESEKEQIVPGTNQEDAVLLPLGTKVFGKIESKSYVWFSFHTEEDTDAVYKVTFINNTPGSNYMEGYLYDEYGTQLGYEKAYSDGTPGTISADQLEADSTYYVRLSPRSTESLEYSLVVKNPDKITTAYKTDENFQEARGAENMQEENLAAGTSPDNAALLPMGEKVSGTVESEAYVWFGFVTGEVQGAEYKITFVDTTPDSNYMEGYLYDEYGTQLGYEKAYHDGTPATICSDQLKDNTVYYVRLNPRSTETLNYALTVKSSEEKREENSLVFETPFEINETQVQFVINEATFIDEQKAKEVLKPVAEAVLQHPDHGILIAGTTATDGTQESCVDLANRRANAVKNLLVQTYGVPESQLQTVGLGYEKDPFERGADRDAEGNFVESEGRKNRRVVILDVENPIAKELLKSNS